MANKLYVVSIGEGDEPTLEAMNKETLMQRLEEGHYGDLKILDPEKLKYSGSLAYDAGLIVIEGTAWKRKPRKGAKGG